MMKNDLSKECDFDVNIVESFENYYKNNQKKIIMYLVKKIGNISDAEDIAQDVFFSCLKNIDNYDSNKSALSTWIYVSVQNRLKNYYRDNKKHQSYNGSFLYEEIDNCSEIEKSIEIEQVRSEIASAMKEMSSLQRQVVLCKYFKYMTTKEIAEKLKITPQYVRVSLSRALKMLQNELKNKDL